MLVDPRYVRKDGAGTRLAYGSFRSRRTSSLSVFVQNGVPKYGAFRMSNEDAWPEIENGVMKLSAAQLSALLEGLDWRRVHEAREIVTPTQPS